MNSGETVAANDLAILLRDTDRKPEAAYVLRQAAEGGDEQARRTSSRCTCRRAT